VTADRAALVAEARDRIARGSKSFAAASRLFDRTTRERAWLLYAWCRACDDLADGQEFGHGMTAVADPQARLATIRTRTAAALAGEATGDAAFDALGLLAREVALPRSLLEDVMAGFALDAAGWQPRTTDDLLRYCYHVAGAVGCLMAVVMGVDPADEATLDRACDLGLAFQLANIARDIGEDAAAGRCYLPELWLAEIGVSQAELMRPEHRAPLATLGTRLAAMAATYEASAHVGAARLPLRAAWAVLAAAGIYGDIAREVACRGATAWDTRVITTRNAKLRWIAKAWWQAQRREKVAESGREGLWTRPRALLAAEMSAGYSEPSLRSARS
jgi:phytoene synthase